MSSRQKIHVFLGAPPPSSVPASVCDAGQEPDDPGPPGWRHLDLTWTDGRLRPATGPGEADWTGTSGGQERRPRTSCNFNIDKNLFGSDDQELAEKPQSGPDEDRQCSAAVHEYLNSCFPAPQPGPETGASHCSTHQLRPEVHPLCNQTQYLATWAQSQALVLRGNHVVQTASSPNKILPSQTPPDPAQNPPSASSSTPELFSPVMSSPGASAELFSPLCSTPHCSSPRVEQGGVVLQATAEGVLCSQESDPTTTLGSPEKSPCSKRTRKSQESRTETGQDVGAAAKLYAPTTVLVHCRQPGHRYSVLVVAVHPCHLKEIKVKSRPSAGTLVPLASIVVTDQSAVEMKVVLWRRAAFWASAVSPGDVLLMMGLQVNEDRWRGETLLQSNFSTRLLILGQITVSTQPAAPQLVDPRSLSALCAFIRERRPLLASLPRRVPQDLNRLPYAPSLRSLRVNTLVHALLRVTHTHRSSEWREEAESRFRSALQSRAVLTVEQADGQQGALLLWGGAVDWLPRFSTHTASEVWDFRLLLVKDSCTNELPELHSTPWSSAHRLHRSDPRLQRFLSTKRRARSDEPDPALELDVETLLSQKYSGVVELQVQISSFSFQSAPSSQNAPHRLMDGTTSLEEILEELSGDIAYAGCGRCAAELGTDGNGIYSPCYPCLPHTAVRRYYRPGVMLVSGRSHSQVRVQVPPVPLQKILEAPPDKLHRTSAPGSPVKNIHVAAEKLLALVSAPKKTFAATVRSHFLCDENSAPISQDFTLLDLQFPPGRTSVVQHQ